MKNWFWLVCVVHAWVGGAAEKQPLSPPPIHKQLGLGPTELAHLDQELMDAIPELAKYDGKIRVISELRVSCADDTSRLDTRARAPCDGDLIFLLLVSPTFEHPQARLPALGRRSPRDSPL